MSEWTGTRHCPNCDAIELSTGVIDDHGRIHTWCLHCGRTFRKYDEHAELVWEDPEWAANERPDKPS